MAKANIPIYRDMVELLKILMREVYEVGERSAQLIIQPCLDIEFEEAESVAKGGTSDYLHSLPAQRTLRPAG